MSSHHRALPFLRAFEAVSRLGMVRSAALELNLTPGAVSHQIKMLEASVGVELFVREKRRLTLSPAGKTFRTSVSTLLRDLERSVEAISPAREVTEKQSLSISASSGFGHIWLAPQLLDVADQLGLASIESHVAREVSQVDWRQVDVAIVYDNPPWTGFTWVALPELRLSPLCTPSLLHLKPMRHPRDLVNHRLLHEDSGGEWQRWCNAAKLSTPPGRNAYFNRLSMAFTSALAGHGVALASDFLANKYLSSGQLVRPVTLSIPAAKRYYIVTLESRANETLIANAIDLLVSISRGEKAGEAA